MLKLKLPTLVRLAPALALCSCAAPKAVVVEDAPKPKKEEAAAPPAPEIPVPSSPDDGIRLPDMLGMPGDGEFKATSNAAPKLTPEPGAVTVRPPTDPPPRPKPKPKEGE